MIYESRFTRTPVTGFNESLIDVLLLGVLQYVEEAQVDSVRLFRDDVQQRLGRLDWMISHRLNRLQLSERQSVALVHADSHDTRV